MKNGYGLTSSKLLNNLKYISRLAGKFKHFIQAYRKVTKTPLIAYTHKYYDKKTGGYKTRLSSFLREPLKL